MEKILKVFSRGSQGRIGIPSTQALHRGRGACGGIGALSSAVVGTCRF